MYTYVHTGINFYKKIKKIKNKKCTRVHNTQSRLAS